MNANQLNELANNAETNHWPAHLGITTDAKKVEYLAARLREAADAETRADGLEDELTEMRLVNDSLQEKSDDLSDQVETLKADLKLAQTQLEQIREIVS